MENINWGIIGCGDVCEKKSGPAFYKIKHSSLVAVMRRNEAKIKDFAQSHGVEKYYTEADKLINDPDINAIYIATPPNMHKRYAIQAMEANKPVYVEKPMGMNYTECLEMIETSKITNQKLFVAFYRRALPYFLKVKALLDENRIGQVLTVDIKHIKKAQASDFDANTHTWRVDKSIAGEGYFYDLAPHTLDILDFLLGKIESAKGYSQNLGHLYDTKDTICAALQFESGVVGTGLWSFVAHENSEQDSIEIIGTNGKITFSTFAFTPIMLITDKISEQYSFTPPEHIEQPLIQTIVDELRGHGHCPSTGISGARTSLVMDRILKEQ